MMVFEATSQESLNSISRNNLHHYILSANTTYASQPLDIAINKPFKSHLKKLKNEFLVDNLQNPIVIERRHVIPWTQ
jgi:hypothetical protein